MNFLPDLPTWATTDECACFVYGFVVGGSIRIFRAGLKWVKDVGKNDNRES